MTKKYLDKLEELIRLIIKDETYFDVNHHKGYSFEIEKIKKEILRIENHS